jgi:hypothetical protein
MVVITATLGEDTRYLRISPVPRGYEWAPTLKLAFKFANFDTALRFAHDKNLKPGTFVIAPVDTDRSGNLVAPAGTVPAAASTAHH